jgi:hypothetical protein
MDRPTATRALIGAILIGGIAQAWLFRTTLGINVVLLTMAVLAVGWIIARRAGRGDRIDRLDWWLPVATVVVAGTIALRSDPTLLFLDAVTAATLLGASMAALGGAAVTRRSALAITILAAGVLGWVCLGIVRVAAAARQSDGTPGWRGRSQLPGWAAPVARGLLIALPVLLMFVALFASADAIFAVFAGRLLGLQMDLGEMPIRVLVAFAVAWPVAGLLAVGVGAARVDRQPVAPLAQSLGAAVAEPLPLLPRLGAIEAATILVAVDVLFATFVFLQLAYLFGGLDTMAAGGITYANYARGGFFQLVAVTGLAGGLVVCLHAVVEERTRGFIWSAVALAGLAGVVLASAALRLALYQQAYGWTELRFYIDATIAWLGIGIVAATLLFLRNQMRWLAHAMAIAAIAVLVGVNAVGPQRLVAAENVGRLLDPALVPPDGRRGLDLDYMLTLDDDAVPDLVRSLPALTAGERAAVMTELRYRWIELAQPAVTAWPAWNLARDEAREAIRPLFDH